MHKLAAFLSLTIVVLWGGTLVANGDVPLKDKCYENSGYIGSAGTESGRSSAGSTPQDEKSEIVCADADVSTHASGSATSGGGVGGAGNASYVSSTGPAKKYVSYDRLTTAPDGQACVTTGYVEEGVQPSDQIYLDAVSREVRATHGLPLDYPPCPEQPQAPGQPAVVETPSMIARRYWERIPLPKPKPAIAPGRAITGKTAYLETKGELSHTYVNATAFGPLQIVAKGSYVVDWGDGETTGPHSLEGAPWPDGRITHQYINIGTYDVVVTERWTATWSLGGETGVLRTLQTTGRIDSFPVQQIQAVIVS